MKIIGRVQEQQELIEAYRSPRAEFIVVYGRRRVGKTYLIEQCLKPLKGIFFHAIGIQDGKLKEQLKEFSKAIGAAFYNQATVMPEKNWKDTFEALTQAMKNVPKKTKITLFLDELPWLATKKSRLIQALGYYWNRYWSSMPNVKLIVCGSSASWLIKNIIYDTGGLHNRYTHSILLQPFNLSETKAFLHYYGIKLNHKQIMQIYMAIGGIPHYLAQLQRGLSAAQNINHLCFKPTGVLFTEFDKLFKSLFKNSKRYIELIKIIAQSREGVSRTLIEENTKYSKKGGTLTDRLNDLELAGFIKSFSPLSQPKQGMYYRILDEYAYFYLKWILPEKSTLLSLHTDNEYWSQKAHTPEYFNWIGYAFESLCYKHISQIRHRLKINAGSRVGTWRFHSRTETSTQIDLVFEREDDAISLIEIKCTEKPFVIDKKYALTLQNKIQVYKTATHTTKQIFLSVISANGLKNNAYATTLVDGIVTLEDFF